MGGNLRRMGPNTGSVILYNHIWTEAMGLCDDDGGNHDITTRNKSTTVYSVIKLRRMLMTSVFGIRSARIWLQEIDATCNFFNLAMQRITQTA